MGSPYFTKLPQLQLPVRKGQPECFRVLRYGQQDLSGVEVLQAEHGPVAVTASLHQELPVEIL